MDGVVKNNLSRDHQAAETAEQSVISDIDKYWFTEHDGGNPMVLADVKNHVMNHPRSCEDKDTALI